MSGPYLAEGPDTPLKIGDAEMGTWRMIRPGWHVNDTTGIHVIRGLDDSDGYDRYEWCIWSGDPHRSESRALGVRPTIHAAKARAAELATKNGDQRS